MNRLFAIAIFALLFTSSTAYAKAIPLDEYLHGVVQAVRPHDPSVQEMVDAPVDVSIRLETGEDTVAQYSDKPTTTDDDINKGDRVVVLKTFAFEGEERLIIIDRYRLPSLGILFSLFLLCATIFAGWRGATSVLGLIFSSGVLLLYTVPTIVHGGDPFRTAIASCFLIAIVSLYVAHGFTKQTSIALTSTLTTLVLSLGLSELFVRFTHLRGMGSEDVFSLQYAGLENINLRGLLLAGITIGVMGVLDDVTTAQTATVQALANAHKDASWKTLFKDGLTVGREHIASLVNTLFLAYAGASLPLLLSFSLNEGRVPFWAILNGEMVSEEVVRTLIGSTILVLAVPISTLAAAWYFGRTNTRN